METPRFHPLLDPASSKLKTRPPKALLQPRPRTWVLHLLHRYDVGLDALNAQLPLPPDPEGLVWGTRPEPLRELGKEDRVFEAALLRGKDPAGRYFTERETVLPGKRRTHAPRKFSLAERVDQHVPGSRPWLFEPLGPYLETALPSIRDALATSAQLISELGFRRVSNPAIEFALQIDAARVHALAQAQYDYLACVTDPRHLSLLVTLLHEQAWHGRGLSHQDPLLESAHQAFHALIRHPMFEVHPYGEVARHEWQSLRCDVLNALMRDGCHSAPTPGMERPTRALPILLCRHFEGFEEADYAAALGWGTPLTHFIAPPGNRYMSSDHPLKAESQQALTVLWEATVLAAGH